MLSRDVVGRVGEEFGQVVVVDLFCQGVGRGDEDVGEETGLAGGEVGEPAVAS